eukprot:1195000-Ditylum_brightwellii.AAC.1
MVQSTNRTVPYNTLFKDPDIPWPCSNETQPLHDNSNKPLFDGFHQCMAVLYYYPHIPIMYPRKPFYLSQPNLEVHFGSGKAEYLKQYKSFIAMYSDRDLSRELRERRSTTSIALLTNDVASYWDISK